MKLMSNNMGMKTSLKYILVILAALSSAISCKKSNMDSAVARFACKIQTKVSGSSWEAEDSVGISGVSGRRTYSNICYKTPAGSSEDFIPTGEAIYYTDSEPVKFTAYYPWKAELTAGTKYDFSVKEQSGMKQFDFLWAEATGKKEDAEPVSFVFSHKMSKLIVTIKGVNGADYEMVRKTICGMSGLSTEGSFDRQSGKISISKVQSDTLTAINNSKNPECNTSVIRENKKDNFISYTMILPPQEFSEENPLKFHIYVPLFQDSDSARYDIPVDLSQIQGNDNKNAFQSGFQYGLTFKISNTSVDYTITDIVPWINSEESSTEATM